MVQGRHHHTLLKQIQHLIGNKLNVYQTLDKIPKILHVSRILQKNYLTFSCRRGNSLRCRGNCLCCRGSGLSFCKIMIQAQFRDKSDNKKTNSKAMNCMF